jgi:hypothetical protein
MPSGKMEIKVYPPGPRVMGLPFGVGFVEINYQLIGGIQKVYHPNRGVGWGMVVLAELPTSQMHPKDGRYWTALNMPFLMG